MVENGAEIDSLEADEILFDIDSADGVSSSTVIARPAKVETATLVASGVDEERSLVFKELATPKLPELKGENRGRLLMQSPTKIFFYWALGSNPYRILHKAFGNDTGSYTLVLKLVDLTHDTEELHQVEAEGSWWFDVRADAEYRAEIGFYAPNRPFVRVMFSNTIKTPRKTPSPRPASDAQWTVSADKFSEVLDVSGFREDAFEVAATGDDATGDQAFSPAAFGHYIGKAERDLAALSADEIRYAMMALAAGVPLEYLKWKISPELFALLQANIDKFNSDAAFASLREKFGMTAEEFEFETEGSAVFGASLVNFPKRFKQRRPFPEYSPVSSSG